MPDVRLGLDENGLGPQLGPLIVTGVMADLNDEALRAWDGDPSVFLSSRLGDSKGLVDHHDVALGEAWARAVASRMGARANNPDELLGFLSLRDRSWLQSPCPSSSFAQCWSAQGETFVASELALRQAHSDLEGLASRGVSVRWAKSAIVCTKRLNDERATGVGRFDVDLHCMEELLLDARKFSTQDFTATCGKIGGIQRYPGRMRHISAPHVVLKESRAISSYCFAGLGNIAFVRDADGSDPLVALSSLIGKWVREVTMKRIVRFYTSRMDGLPNASGYNDPVTNRFVQLTQDMRSRLGIEPTCFRRDQGDETHGG